MGSPAAKNSRRGATENLIVSLGAKREENSGESSAPRTPVSNCTYPTGVRVAGVETVGRPGFASGSSATAVCPLAPDAKRGRAANATRNRVICLWRRGLGRTWLRLAQRDRRTERKFPLVLRSRRWRRRN